jgi:acyl-[acyl carrier protein]--UDP-N-acetylglucosamine O-acyltransferase
LIGDFVVMGGILGIRQLVFVLSEALLVGQDSDLGVDDVLL